MGDGAQPPPWFGQPLPWTRQHHSFLGTDQPACQFANPSSQLYGSAGAGACVGWPQMWWILQHHCCFAPSQVKYWPTAQLYGSTGPTGAGGAVGGGKGGGMGRGGGGGRVGGGVGDGVGGIVGVVCGKAVVAQPRPTVMQQ